MTGKKAAKKSDPWWNKAYFWKKVGPPKRSVRTLCASCAPMYGYEPLHHEGISLGGQCFGCSGHAEILGMFMVPHPDGGPSGPLTEAGLRMCPIVCEEDEFAAFGE